MIVLPHSEKKLINRFRIWFILFGTLAAAVVILPKLEAALVTLWSKPDNVAVTVITTKGVPKIICANIIPV